MTQAVGDGSKFKVQRMHLEMIIMVLLVVVLLQLVITLAHHIGTVLWQQQHVSRTSSNTTSFGAASLVSIGANAVQAGVMFGPPEVGLYEDAVQLESNQQLYAEACGDLHHDYTRKPENDWRETLKPRTLFT